MPVTRLRCLFARTNLPISLPAGHIWRSGVLFEQNRVGTAAVTPITIALDDSSDVTVRITASLMCVVPKTFLVLAMLKRRFFPGMCGVIVLRMPDEGAATEENAEPVRFKTNLARGCRFLDAD